MSELICQGECNNASITHIELPSYAYICEQLREGRIWYVHTHVCVCVYINYNIQVGNVFISLCVCPLLLLLIPPLSQCSWLLFDVSHLSFTQLFVDVVDDDDGDDD